MEAMKSVVLRGALPGGTKGVDISFSQPGVPMLSAYYLQSRERPEGSDDEAFMETLLDEAIAYAGTIARVHAVLAYLKLDLDLRNELPTHAEMMLTGTIGVRSRKQACERLGVSPEQLKAALAYAEKRSGVVIGLSADVLRQYEYIETNEGGESHEIAIRCPRGVDASCLIGLEPQTRAEWKELESLLA